MPDDRLEEQLRSVLRREGDELTLIITPQELDRRLDLRRRTRAGRRLSLVAAAIAVVAVGGITAISNGWLGGSAATGGVPVFSVAPSGTPARTLERSASPAMGPSVDEPTTADGQRPCLPIDPSAADAPPAVVAGVVPGDSLGYRGTVIASRWNGVGSGSPGSWEGLPDGPSPISVGSGQRLQITSDACIQQVTAEALLAVTAQAPKASPTPIALSVLGGEGSWFVDIEPPPTGGWTVRIRTNFLTSDGSEAWSETLYRVFGLFDAPRLTMQGSAGTPAVWATAVCPNYRLASGASAEDLCGGSYEPITDRDPLTIAKGASVRLSLNGNWQIDHAKVVAVEADLVAAGQYAPEYSVAFLDKAALEQTLPMTLDPGAWIVRVALNASRSGDAFGAWYDLPLIVAP